MDPKDKIDIDYKTLGFDSDLSRKKNETKTTDYIGGANFDVKLDEMLFNRMIKLKDLRVAPQGNEPGKIYWDGDNKKFKMWYSASVGWVDIAFTSTSTTSTSSSSSSTSTTSTSSSSSSSSTSTTSTSSSTSTTTTL